MSETSRAVNTFFKEAIRSEVDTLVENLMLSDRQKSIYEMFYVRKLDIDFIADSLGCCSRVVQRELRIIRKKIVKSLGL